MLAWKVDSDELVRFNYIDKSKKNYNDESLENLMEEYDLEVEEQDEVWYLHRIVGEDRYPEYISENLTKSLNDKKIHKIIKDLNGDPEEPKILTRIY
jgi:hypothetical protein